MMESFRNESKSNSNPEGADPKIIVVLDYDDTLVEIDNDGDLDSFFHKYWSSPQKPRNLFELSITLNILFKFKIPLVLGSGRLFADVKQKDNETADEARIRSQDQNVIGAMRAILGTEFQHDKLAQKLKLSAFLNEDLEKHIVAHVRANQSQLKGENEKKSANGVKQKKHADSDKRPIIEAIRIKYPNAMIILVDDDDTFKDVEKIGNVKFIHAAKKNLANINIHLAKQEDNKSYLFELLIKTLAPQNIYLALRKMAKNGEINDWNKKQFLSELFKELSKTHNFQQICEILESFAEIDGYSTDSNAELGQLLSEAFKGLLLRDGPKKTCTLLQEFISEVDSKKDSPFLFHALPDQICKSLVELQDEGYRTSEAGEDKFLTALFSNRKYPSLEEFKINHSELSESLYEDIEAESKGNPVVENKKQSKATSLFHEIFNKDNETRSDIRAFFGLPSAPIGDEKKGNVYNWIEAIPFGIIFNTFKNIAKIFTEYLPLVCEKAFERGEKRFRGTPLQILCTWGRFACKGFRLVAQRITSPLRSIREAYEWGASKHPVLGVICAGLSGLTSLAFYGAIALFAAPAIIAAGIPIVAAKIGAAAAWIGAKFAVLGAYAIPAVVAAVSAAVIGIRSFFKWVGRGFTKLVVKTTPAEQARKKLYPECKYERQKSYVLKPDRLAKSKNPVFSQENLRKGGINLGVREEKLENSSQSNSKNENSSLGLSSLYRDISRGNCFIVNPKTNQEIREVKDEKELSERIEKVFTNDAAKKFIQAIQRYHQGIAQLSIRPVFSYVPWIQVTNQNVKFFIDDDDKVKVTISAGPYQVAFGAREPLGYLPAKVELVYELHPDKEPILEQISTSSKLLESIYMGEKVTKDDILKETLYVPKGTVDLYETIKAGLRPRSSTADSLESLAAQEAAAAATKESLAATTMPLSSSTARTTMRLDSSSPSSSSSSSSSSTLSSVHEGQLEDLQVRREDLTKKTHDAIFSMQNNANDKQNSSTTGKKANETALDAALNASSSGSNNKIGKSHGNN